MGENQNAALWIVATDDRTAMKMLQYMPLCGIVICWYVVTMQHCRDGVCIVGAEVFCILNIRAVIAFEFVRYWTNNARMQWKC